VVPFPEVSPAPAVFSGCGLLSGSANWVGSGLLNRKSILPALELVWFGGIQYPLVVQELIKIATEKNKAMETAKLSLSRFCSESGRQTRFTKAVITFI
jgi:hypothetical protein